MADSTPIAEEGMRAIARVVDARPVLPAAHACVGALDSLVLSLHIVAGDSPMLPPGVARRAVTTLSLSAPAQDAMSKEGAGCGRERAVEGAVVGAGQAAEAGGVAAGGCAAADTDHRATEAQVYGPSSGLDTALAQP